MADLALIEKKVRDVAPLFQQVLVDNSIVFEREVEFAMQLMYKSTYLAGIAQSNQQSLMDAITNVAAIGITLNPASKLAYLVPREKAICLDLSWMGMVHLATDTGAILWAKAELVHQADVFTMRGIDEKPDHQRNPFATDDQRGPVVGAYCVAKMPDGVSFLTETMSIEDVLAIRDRSESWKAHVSSGHTKKTPWATDRGEMIRKTVVKRAAKYWKRSTRLDNAIHYLNTDGGEGLAPINNEPTPSSFSVSNLEARISGAETLEQVVELRREGLSKASAERDKAAYERVRRAVAKRRQELGGFTDVVAKEV